MHASALPLAPGSTEPHTDMHGLVGVVVLLIDPCSGQDQQRYDELQELRRQHDHAFDRWLPHITLIPPFVLSQPSKNNAASLPSPQGTTLEELVQMHEDMLTQIVRAATEVCKQHASHQLRLDQVSTFPLRECTNVHIRPYPTNFQDKRTRAASSPWASASSVQGADQSSRRLVDLQRSLSDSITPLLRSEGVSRKRQNMFKPHVSVGQSTSPRATWQLCTATEKMLGIRETKETDAQAAGMLCNVDRIQLMIKPKGSDDPYHVHTELPLNTNTRT